ncbi:MAG: phosphate ABC transporter permease PstA [Defluviitaleaceae bacterium]|nr:phosphate ABC transporter permease PstA [Defluviitaleaceae bacterium]
MRKIKNIINYFKLYLGIGFSVLTLCVILFQVLINGFRHLSFSFLFGMNEPTGHSIIPMVVNTFIIVGLTLVIAVPIGIGSAIYLNEYANKDSFIVKAIRVAIETLSGIPSVIYGLFGFLFYVVILGFTWSLMAGILTVSIMILPIIIRSTEESLKSVPLTYREGSFALGAGKFQTIIKVVLPSSITGILASIILSVGRLVGETAALLLTAGTLATMPTNLFSSGATLAVFMYTITVEGTDMDRAYATAVVLMSLVLILNMLANFVANKFRKV